ncbi:hypothetical protein [Indioceanicola profundi]|uniref:hypothetical protein n=1 Tax=Indioceanicola profundi TaxID=2220096 RepID=UPI000E6AABD1|nr:hypothetical protein [Indioceanicola profundi]
MNMHKFQVGQSLVFTPGRFEHQKGSDLFEVTRLLPAEGTELQYRVKNTGSGQERVVRESQLHRG